MSIDPNNYHCEHLDDQDHTMMVRFPDKFSLASALFWVRVLEVIAVGLCVWCMFSNALIACLTLLLVIIAFGSIGELWDAEEWISEAKDKKEKALAKELSNHKIKYKYKDGKNSRQ